MLFKTLDARGYIASDIEVPLTKLALFEQHTHRRVTQEHVLPLPGAPGLNIGEE